MEIKNRITIEHVRNLPADLQAEWWSSLTPEEADGYLHSWEFLARDEQLPPEGDWTHWLYLAGRGAGKALALDTPILTVNRSWTTMGELTTDDVIFDDEGKPTAILQVHPVQEKRTCFKIIFDEGHIVADGDHLWEVDTWFQNHPRMRRHVISTFKLRNMQSTFDRPRHSIKTTKPLQYPEAEIPDPYQTGLLMGSGLLKDNLPVTRIVTTKHLESSVEQRVALLRGLMDLGGCITETGAYEFSTHDFELMKSVMPLIWGLGMSSKRRFRGEAVLEHYACFRSDDFNFLTGQECSPVRRRLIRSIESVKKQSVRCITVDSPSKLFLAGRQLIPTHNTRTGAESARQKVKEGCMRLGLIAPTASDARDVMVEGESGILATSWENDVDCKGNEMGKPLYEPSKRRLTWDNGAIATLYSADEPERLRGPQHDYIWADELCVAEGTTISTPSGDVKIEDIKVGDLVTTRAGPQRVLNSGKTDRTLKTLFLLLKDGSALEATPNHPIMTRTGWRAMKDLRVSIDQVITECGHASIEMIIPNKFHRWVEVYNIEVEEFHEYFANGILTHNCSWRRPETWDLAMFGLRLGRNPQAFISTTPKPKKLIMELLNDPSCVVTKGTTYDNRANLAENFFKTVITKYEGTRLGSQELLGVLLEEAEGALWSREILDATRVREFDWKRDAVRIVVAVDPAITSNKETSDECGIIVAAIDSVGHGFVLADYSGIYTPATWAKKAVKAYKMFEADRIVAEGNQGGEMVKHTILTEDSAVPVKIVHASRGKAARAEPISSLFEQNRAHIVSSLTQLEDQLCTWEPLSGTASPDRLDGMVWALTELMIGKGVTGVGKLTGAF